jgi:hypothetical protein
MSLDGHNGDSINTFVLNAPFVDQTARVNHKGEEETSERGKKDHIYPSLIIAWALKLRQTKVSCKKQFESLDSEGVLKTAVLFLNCILI